MTNQRIEGIVGKFPNSNRNGEPIGQGSTAPVKVPNLTQQAKSDKNRKNGGSQ